MSAARSLVSELRNAVAPGEGWYEGKLYLTACGCCGAIAAYVKRADAPARSVCLDCLEKTPGAAAFAQRGEARVPPPMVVPRPRGRFVCTREI